MPALNQIEQFNNGNIFPEQYIDTYIATEHICKSQLKIQSGVVASLKQAIHDAGLFLGDETVIEQIITGLIKGNIILQGPPGTGKTTLAKLICNVFNVDYDEATAISDWTTYDTIGGLQPSVDNNGKEILVGKMGQLTNSVWDCCNAVNKHDNFGEHGKQACWLILDELNRCEIDKVFGDLFTAFGSDDPAKRKINLWFESDPNKKCIYIPNRYRIIGAMNSTDKNFVFDISQGLSRRFTFIDIQPPTEEHFDTEISNAREQAAKRVQKKITSFSGKAIDDAFFTAINTDSSFSHAENIMNDFIKHVRYSHVGDETYLGMPIGTAQIIDLYETIYISVIIADYLDQANKTTAINNIIDAAIASRIIPQLEGFDYLRLSSFCEVVENKTEYSFLKHTQKSLMCISR